MNELQVIKSESFGNLQCDIYSNGKDIFMTATQLGQALGYSDPNRNINRLVSRHPHLKSTEFSIVVNLTPPQGGIPDVRIFNEDGMYEVTMLSNTSKAKDFRAWIRKILKPLRKGELQIVSNLPQLTDNEKFLMLAQNNVALEKRVIAIEQTQQKIEDKLQTALTVFTKPHADHWVTDMNNAINLMVETYKRSPSGFRGQLYKELETTANKSLSRRVTCLKTRLKNRGATYKECEAVTKLDAISHSKDLRLIFEAIVKKHQAFYAAKEAGQ